MPKTKTDKRSRLIQTAVKLSYRHGFRTTSLADIAEAAKVPVGNVYYYFKTKDEIGEAIVEQRLLELRTLQEQWDQKGSPKERLLAWMEDQFRAIGLGDTSRKLAAQLFSSLQGASVVAHGSGDPDLVVMETKRLKDWVGGFLI